MEKDLDRSEIVEKRYKLKPQDAAQLAIDVCVYRKVQTFVIEGEGVKPHLKVTSTQPGLNNPAESQIAEYELIET